MTKGDAALLYALRSQVDAVRAQIDAWILRLEEHEGTVSACDHPLEQRVPATTGGGPRKFYCKACNEEVLGA